MKSEKNRTSRARPDQTTLLPPLLCVNMLTRQHFRVTWALAADSLTDANCPNEENVTHVERVYIG